jgi:hypothetical protein
MLLEELLVFNTDDSSKVDSFISFFNVMDPYFIVYSNYVE